MYAYNIPDVHQYEFERFRAFVETAYRDSLKGKPYVEPVKVVRATSDLEEIPKYMRGKTNTDTTVGYAWHNTGQMWVKGGRAPIDVCRTTIHELAHLRVTAQSHGPKWRRTFGVALAQWLRGEGKDWLFVQHEVSNLVWQYRKYRRYTPQGCHNTYGEYRSRVFAEINDIMWAAKRVCGSE